MTDRFPAMLAAVAFLAASCTPAPQQVEREIQAKGRHGTIRLAASDAGKWVSLYTITERMMTRVNDTLDPADGGSDISRINRIGGDARIQITHDTYRLLDLARHYSDLTGGAYDFTVAPAAYLWGFEGGAVPTNRPSSDLIQAAMLGVGAKNLSLFDNGAAALTHMQTRISVSSLADAYAADMAVVEAREKGIANAVIQVGGSARALGTPGGGASWEIPLADPFFTNGTLGRLVVGTGVALSRSSLRERNVTIEGLTYGHILNPQTGTPATGTAMAVVSGPIAVKCSAVAQALVVAGIGGAPEILRRFPRCEALIVPDAQPIEIWMTRGFSPRVKLNTELRGSVRIIETGPLVEEPAIDDEPSAATPAAPAAPPPAAK